MKSRQYKAVFFDLDGTLLPIDMDAFLKGYFARLGQFAAEKGYDPEQFSQALGKATYAMTQTTGGFNEERFWQTFLPLVNGTREEYEIFLGEFYEGPFNELGADVIPNPAAAEVIKILKEKNYPLYLTTMPLFPRIAVENRLKWAGCDPASFDRITTYDNSTSTKPYVEYYQENIDCIGLPPEDILMVGNNTKEDLAAMKLGCDAYLVTDCLLDPIDFDIDSVKHGSLDDFLDFVKQLPECE